MSCCDNDAPVSTIAAILEYGEEVEVDHEVDGENTAFAQAVNNDNIPLMKLLLKHGANVDGLDEEPAILNAQSLEAVDVLVAGGANLDATAKDHIKTLLESEPNSAIKRKIKALLLRSKTDRKKKHKKRKLNNNEDEEEETKKTKKTKRKTTRRRA